MRNTHPSMMPGAIIGYRKNGTPIRLIAGGAPEDGDGGAGDGQGGTGAGDGGQGGTQNDGGTGTGTGGQASDASTGQQQGTADAGATPSGEGNAMRAVREEARQARQAAREARERLATLEAENTRRDEETKARNLALAKALGLPTDEPPDPAQLAKDLAAAQEQTKAEITRREARERELTVELELLKQASRHGANPELLVDSRSFMSKLGNLDPTSDDFASDLGEAIKAAVEANPAFKLSTTPAAGPAGGSSGTSNAAGSGDGTGDGQAAKPKSGKQGTTAPPARSGTDDGHNATPGGNRQWTIEDVNAASPQEVDKAIDQGLLKDLGFNPRKARR